MSERRKGTTPLRGTPLDEHGAIAFEKHATVAQQDRDALVKMGELLKTGGMSDGAFLVGQVRALLETITDLERQIALLENDAMEADEI